MQPRVKKIIEELGRIDPSFKTDETDFVVLITELIETKPDLVINKNFIENLRKSLLNRAEVARIPVTTKTHRSPIAIWIIRLAPIGALALLFFILYPRTNHPTPTPLSEERNIQFNTTNDGYGTGAIDTRLETQTYKTAAPESVSGFTHAVTMGSIRMDRPGFIVVRSTSGEIVGVSTYLTPGTTVGVRINFKRPLSGTESFSTEIYQDNGDGVFSPKDTRI